MNKILTFALLSLCLTVSLNSFAAPANNSDSSPDQVHVTHDINDIVINITDQIDNEVEKMHIVIAANTHDQEAMEINKEIVEINKEMSEMGKEFNEDMSEMGKELKGLVKMLRKMGDKKTSNGAFLGILLDEEASVDDGILLLGVTPDGPAQNAGLQADDVITSINSESMARTKDKSPASQLYRTMKKVKPGQQLTLLIDRKGQQMKITFSAGKRGDHLQHGINFLADDLEKRINKKIHIEVDNDAFAEIELYPINKKLGRYFGSDKGMLVLKIPDDNQFSLNQGDVILKIGDRSPNSTSKTWRILESYDSGEDISLTLMRDQKEITLSIKKP
ncbi:MAG: PDZ domain-containing protein [Gammaproteobacteria bacterium]|nr:PDZ domain-containing protein [Gammaproteobacteria bacterium]